MNALCVALVVAGVFFLFMGTVGLLRFPDCYTRMHAAGKCDTLGSLLVVTGLALHAPPLTAIKILFVSVFIFLTGPTSTHAIARAALRNKLPVWAAERSQTLSKCR